MQRNTSFQTLLENLITDAHTIQLVEQKIPKHILQSSFGLHRSTCLNALHLVDKQLNDYLEQHRRNAKEYYTAQFQNSKQRKVVFDVGYNGSVARALNTITGMAVDKIYLWQTKRNKRWDCKNHTSTFCLTKNNYSFRLGIQIIYEELFSPLQGSCIGFDQQAQPIFENLSITPQMKETFACIQLNTDNFIHAICQQFGNYTPYLRCKDANGLSTLLLYLLGASPNGEQSLFKSICFSDMLSCGNPIDLQDKLEKFKKQPLLKKLVNFIAYFR